MQKTRVCKYYWVKVLAKKGENYGGMGEGEGLQLAFQWEDFWQKMWLTAQLVRTQVIHGRCGRITRLKTSFT